jgi:ArsR family transcriptional regulator
MGVNRVHQWQAQILSGLAHPTRLAILEALREGELSVGQIAEKLGLEQANCSQHLSILRTKELVTRRRSANHVFYEVANSGAVRLLDDLTAYTRSRLADTVNSLRGIRAGSGISQR